MRSKRAHYPVVAAGLVGLTAAAMSCGSPAAPTSAGIRLRGSVIPAASDTLLRVEDGPNADKTTSTDAQGKYVFEGLERGGFRVTASRSGYAPLTKSITLAAESSLDFELALLPFASVIPVDSLTIIGINDALRAFGEGLNIGTGCATQIAGVLNLRDATTQAVYTSRAVEVPATLVVKPQARFQYSGCCFSRAELARWGAYFVNFTWTTVPCP